MEDEDVIEALREQSEEYRKIENDHKKLNRTLDAINKKKFLTTEEDVQKKKLQKQKLQLKDRLAELKRDFEQDAN
ncbi:MAG: DUF465 domain-containing protein [Nitrospira sp.]|nr:DUF465 domain-containing protein [Nitrospira sp.]